jgi:hypothetical protein
LGYFIFPNKNKNIVMDMYLPYLKRFVLTIFLGFLFTLCFATTYYIDPGGNDATGNGSIGNPWKTLRKATQTVTTGGNIIHINAGTYFETQQSFLAVGVSIEGAGNTVSIIKSDITGQYSTLLNLDSPNDINGAQSVSKLSFDGQYVSESNYKTWIAIAVTGRSNVLIHDCKIINFKQRGVVFDGNDADDPVMDPGHYATGNKFYNNTVLNSAENNGIFGAGLLNIGSQMGMEIYDNTMIQDQRVDFKNGWPIKPWNNGWLKGVKIYNNILTKAPYKGTYPGENGDWDFCLEFFNVEGLEIYNNTIQGSIDLNYSRKGSYAFSTWIHHNTVGRTTVNPNFESGILLEFRTEYALIENNILNNVSSGIQFNTRTVNQDGGFPNPGGGTPVGGFSYLLNNTIRNNLFSNLYQGDGSGGAGGILVASESGNDPQINGLNIYNNTIIAKSGDAPGIGLDFTSGENGNATNINIQNNIVNGFNFNWLRGSSPNTAMNVVVLTHNDAFGNGNGNLPSWPGGNPTAYTYNNNLSVNPLFVSATDFHLQVTSPVIDKGVNLGIPFTGIAPDMGYAEFGSTILAVKLVEFTVKENDGTNLLQWTTAAESNSDHFNIERSNDNQLYETIGRINTSGSSTIETRYNFTDATPSKGTNYYRLVMIDKTGKEEYSKIISITNKENQSTVITYINLSSTTNTVIIKVNSTKTQTATLSIIDVTGRTVLNTPVQLQKGSNSFTKIVPALFTGVYYVKLFSNGQIVIKNTFTIN